MFKTILATASFALLAVTMSAPAHAGRMNGTGGVNGLDTTNGVEEAGGPRTGSGGYNGLGSENGMGLFNGLALTGVGAEGFKVHTIEIALPSVGC